MLFGAFAQSTQQASKGPKKRTGKARQANEQVQFAVSVANNFVRGAIDEEAAMMDHEEWLIVEGITDQIEHNEAAIKVLTKASGPTALFLGLGLWSIRCYTIWVEKHPRKPKPPNGGQRIPFPLVSPPPVSPYTPFQVPPIEQDTPSTASPNGTIVFADNDLADLMGR